MENLLRRANESELGATRAHGDEHELTFPCSRLRLIVHQVGNQAPYRSRTMRELTWYDDNTGSIRRVDGR
jgi:hypothetical protein